MSCTLGDEIRRQRAAALLRSHQLRSEARDEAALPVVHVTAGIRFVALLLRATCLHCGGPLEHLAVRGDGIETSVGVRCLDCHAAGRIRAMYSNGELPMIPSVGGKR